MTDDLRQPLLQVSGPPDDPFLVRSESRWRRQAKRALWNVAAAGLAAGTVLWLLTSAVASDERGLLRVAFRLFGMAAPSVLKGIAVGIGIIWFSACAAQFINSTTDDLAEQIAKAVASELRKHR